MTGKSLFTRVRRGAGLLHYLSITAFAVFLCLIPEGCGTSDPPQFDADRAWAHLVKQCDYGPRVPGSSARDSVAFYLTRSLATYGAAVSTQRFSVRDPYSDRSIPMINVIGSFYPDRDRRVMLAAHYDSRPWADEEDDDLLKTQPVLGANDGASGVAVLLEIGRLLSVQDPAGVGVDVVFFDGEDYGKKNDLEYYLLGSKFFVSTRPDYHPVCGILVDMVAGNESTIAKEAYSRTYAVELTDELFTRAERLGLDFFQPTEGGAVYDDHVPFLMAGIDVVDLFGYDYRHWHTVHDVPDNCSKEKMAQVGVLILDFVYDFPY